MTQEEKAPWFVFTVQGTEGYGVEIPKLARLLESLSATFYAIARAKIGTAGPRPGRRTIAEETLAGIRLAQVLPGSTRIELAPPPAATQAQLPILEEPTADDVALEFYQEVRRIEAAEPVTEGGFDVRRRVRTVIEDAAEIGSQAEIIYRPLTPRSGFHSATVLRTTIRTRGIPTEDRIEHSTRRRRLSGHAYMADVEPGRQRLRLKLPDGRDVTLEANEELKGRILAAIDRVVEIEVEEQLEGDVTTSRSVRGIEVLPSSGSGSDQPPKSIEELEREQNLPKERPDYQALASAVWETEEQVAEFEEHLMEIRRSETG